MDTRRLSSCVLKRRFVFLQLRPVRGRVRQRSIKVSCTECGSGGVTKPETGKEGSDLIYDIPVPETKK